MPWHAEVAADRLFVGKLYYLPLHHYRFRIIRIVANKQFAVPEVPVLRGLNKRTGALIQNSPGINEILFERCRL